MFSDSSSHSTPKDVFLHLLATIMLYLSVYAIITLLFSCINILFPDPLYYYFSSELNMIRLSTAMLIVAFPVYILMMKLIHRDITKNPSKGAIGARKWLTYLTLFLAALVIIIDVITLLYNFLNGELSVRFYLKVLVVLVVGIAVFGYYLWDIKHEGAPDKQKNNMFTWLASGLVVASIVASFLVGGSPWYQRDVRFDERRVSDLQSIQYQIVNHWQQKEALPQNLDELTDSISGFTAPTDPETSAAYEYVVKDSLSFSLCATFTTENKTTTSQAMYPYPNDPYSENWNHGTGRVCFDRNIDPELYKPVTTVPVR